MCLGLYFSNFWSVRKWLLVEKSGTAALTPLKDRVGLAAVAAGGIPFVLQVFSWARRGHLASTLTWRSRRVFYEGGTSPVLSGLPAY